MTAINNAVKSLEYAAKVLEAPANSQFRENIEDLKAEGLKVEKLRAAMAQIERACAPGVDQSEDELEMFIRNVRQIARKALA